MTVGWIRRESSFALYLFMWVSTILEYIGVAEKLRSLGLQEVEKRRDTCLRLRDQGLKCVSHSKMFKRIKAIPQPAPS